MSVAATQWAGKVLLKSPVLRKVLLAIAFQADRFGRVKDFSLTALARRCGLSSFEFFEALAALYRLNVIVVATNGLIYLRVRMEPEKLVNEVKNV